MKVVWTQAAVDHLLSIQDYVAADSPTYARRLVDRLWNRTKQLEAFPNSGAVVPDYGNPRVRELLERPYRIIYRVTEARVEVLHSARELPSDVP